MAILRNPSRNKYTIVSNSIFHDKRLSLKAVGLLVSLLSLPDNWEFSENGLNKIFQKDGLSSIRSGIKQLEDAGYLIRRQIRSTSGRMGGAEWIISETPRSPTCENPISVNHRQVNTNESKYLKEYNACFRQESGSKKENDWFDDYIEWYFDLYKDQTGRQHPRLKLTQMQKVKDSIVGFCEENEGADSLLYDMAEDFFKSVKKTDYNINHFVSEGILENRLYRNR